MGTDHLLSNKPNQDAYYHLEHPDLLVGIVCDGCGDPTAPHSEVGARILSRVTCAQTMLYAYGGEHILFEAIQNKVIRTINEVALMMASVPINLELDKDLSELLQKNKKRAINDHFLCTIVGYAITTLKTYFFCIGDGTIFVNGTEVKIGPFPNNTPPYAAYHLMESSIDPALLDFKIAHVCDTADLQHFLIGSDGVQDLIKNECELTPDGKSHIGSISQFWGNDLYYSNVEAVNRRLAVINKPKQVIDWEAKVARQRKGLLHDDTTLLAGRRKCNI